MVEETENDEFYEKLGEEGSPVAIFIKTIKECGGTVTKKGDDHFIIEDGCSNLYYHESDNYKEVFCRKCGVSVSIAEFISVNEVISKETEVSALPSDEDEFLDLIGKDNLGD